PSLPEAVDAERGDSLVDVQKVWCVASDVAGKAEVGRQGRAVANPPGAGPHAVFAIDGSPRHPSLARKLEDALTVFGLDSLFDREVQDGPIDHIPLICELT